MKTARSVLKRSKCFLVGAGGYLTKHSKVYTYFVLKVEILYNCKRKEHNNIFFVGGGQS